MIDKEKDIQTASNEAGHGFAEEAKQALEALQHAQSCNGYDEEGEPCTQGKDDDNEEDWHDEDSARARIEERPLSIEVRSDWHAIGEEVGKPSEYRILLGTGGPASQIVGDLDKYGQPESAHYEYQDWGTPWTPARLSRGEEETILEWAQTFYFGE